MGASIWAARHIELEGALNVRDIGGVPTTHGRTVRTGCLYRGAELCALTDGDHDVVTALGIRVVVDLRGEVERLARPDRLPDTIEVVARTTPSQRSQPAETLEEQIAAGTIPVRDDEFLLGSYVWQLDGGLVPEFRRILELAVDAPGRPVLFHCAAGKDRTGLAAAIVLGVLGVDHESILADYELSTERWAGPRLAALDELLIAHEVTPADVRHLVEARTDVMRRAIDHLTQTWGGFDTYAVDNLGLPSSFPDTIREALTD